MSRRGATDDGHVGTGVEQTWLRGGPSAGARQALPGLRTAGTTLFLSAQRRELAAKPGAWRAAGQAGRQVCLTLDSEFRSPAHRGHRGAAHLCPWGPRPLCRPSCPRLLSPPPAELPQQDVAAAPEEPGRQLTKQRKQPACPNPPWPLVMLLLSRPPRGAHKEAGLSQHSGSGLMAGQAP